MTPPNGTEVEMEVPLARPRCTTARENGRNAIGGPGKRREIAIREALESVVRTAQEALK